MKYALALLTAAFAVSAGSASAAQIHLVASPSTVAPGAAVRVSAPSSPCLAGDQVTLISSAYPGHAFGIGAVYGHVGSHGAFSVRAHIRTNARPGRYHVSVRCGGGNLPVLAYFRVR